MTPHKIARNIEDNGDSDKPNVENNNCNMLK